MTRQKQQGGRAGGVQRHTRLWLAATKHKVSARSMKPTASRGVRNTKPLVTSKGLIYEKKNTIPASTTAS